MFLEGEDVENDDTDEIYRPLLDEQFYSDEDEE
jgi:hypothetical protein